jgi:hypothetical protein
VQSLFKTFPNGKWLGEDGELVEYFNWKREEHNGGDTKESCASVDSNSDGSDVVVEC